MYSSGGFFFKFHPMELVFYIDPHTLAVREVRERKCTKCGRCLPDAAFYNAPRGRRTKFCRRCYDRKYMEMEDRKTTAQHIRAATKRANNRSRFKKSTGPPIGVDEVTQLWEACQGKCANCDLALVWECNPRKRSGNRAVLDRIDTADNRSYHNNAQWLCTICNEEKGGWDLAVQLQHDIEALRSKLRAMKKRKKNPPRSHYEAILIPAKKICAPSQSQHAAFVAGNQET